ncbi:Zn-dependent peptidase ImmA (M78 family) [Lactobacillus colini]|uniref:Zn-dependent peptidase ImmA (M78 family) n=1 Tax=Lactobacillus colini TaxID=1819254 RepID=A0ABS4MGY6_9LACO|nr:ImmA/IrrE family metallo-endopeptidase [Lactobacillus colini]MBP2058942.1 Zn-dependent peptidase ImmA (M78 family) [Lactobacillus colini]
MKINDRNKEELQDALLTFAKNHGISPVLISVDPYYPSVSLKQSRKIIINTNWHNESEIPFSIGHEIGHLMLDDRGVIYLKSFAGKCSEEKPADLYALKLIYDYSKNRGDYFEDPGTFMQCYGIPERMAEATKALFEHDKDLYF